jgi:hypothetical protein
MKKSTNKKSSSVKSRFWQMVIIVTMIVGGSATQASAFDLGKFVGEIRQGANSFLDQIRNNPTISSILKQVNEITTLFGPEIQKITNISQADFDKLQGVLGQMSPREAKEAIDNKKTTPEAAPTTLHHGKSSLAASELAADRELGLAAQKIRKQNIEEAAQLSDGANSEAAASQNSAQESQSANSSQDVLKILSRQSSNQSAIMAAQARLLALQHSNMQDLKTQMAVINQANASFERRQEGEVQKKIIEQQETSAAAIQNKVRSYVQEGY